MQAHCPWRMPGVHPCHFWVLLSTTTHAPRVAQKWCKHIRDMLASVPGDAGIPGVVPDATQMWHECMWGNTQTCIWQFFRGSRVHEPLLVSLEPDKVQPGLWFKFKPVLIPNCSYRYRGSALKMARFGQDVLNSKPEEILFVFPRVKSRLCLVLMTVNVHLLSCGPYIFEQKILAWYQLGRGINWTTK